MIVRTIIHASLLLVAIPRARVLGAGRITLDECSVSRGASWFFDKDQEINVTALLRRGSDAGTRALALELGMISLRRLATVGIAPQNRGRAADLRANASAFVRG